MLVLALVEARFPAGTHELYQMPLGLRPADEGWSERVICEVEGWTLYDALADPAHGRALLHLMRGSRDVKAAEGTLSFRWAESAGAGVGGTVDVRPVGVEQSNSSIVFGETLILKAFRRVEPGLNPELELLRFLSDARVRAHRAAGGLVRLRGPPAGRDARHPAGVPRRRAGRLGARAGRDRQRAGGVPRPPARARRSDRAHALRARLGLLRPGVRAGGAEHRGARAADRDDRRGDRARLPRPARQRGGRADRRARRGRARAAAGALARRRRRAA